MICCDHYFVHSAVLHGTDTRLIKNHKPLCSLYIPLSLEFSYNHYKKLRYREDNSVSIVLSWCTS